MVVMSPLEDKGKRQHEDGTGRLAVEDEDEGAHPGVEGRLGHHRHPRQDHLHHDGDDVGLLACCIHGHSWSIKAL